MSQQDRIAEIEDLTVKEFKAEIILCLESLKKGAKPGNAVELLGAALNITLLGDDLKAALEHWLQVDLWENVDGKKK